MADSYVTSGAKIECSCGDKTSSLTVYADRTVFLTEKPMANISDHVSLYHIAPFGKCHTTKYPATGSATSANHGCLTPMPCIPGTTSEWINGKKDYIIKGAPALLKSSYCRCQWGGIITIVDDGQVETPSPNLDRETPLNVETKQLDYKRNLTSHYQPSFTFQEKLSPEKERKSQSIFSEEISRLQRSCETTTNWLGSPIHNESHLRLNIEPQPSTENQNVTGEIIQDDEYNSPIRLYGHVSNLDAVEIETVENSPQTINEIGRLTLMAFDAMPLIRNTKASLTFTIDALIAGLSITVSVGVDNNLRRYIQLEIDSWIGGDFTDLVNGAEINEYLKKKKYKKAFSCLSRKYGKRLAKLVQIKPTYNTCVEQPLYDWLDCGAYVDLDLKLDKLLNINIGSEKITNIEEVWKNGYVKISSTIELPNLSLKFGWDSTRIEEPNVGFFLEIEFQKFADSNQPVGLSFLKDAKNNQDRSWIEKPLYQPEKFDVQAVGKIGSRWTYTWQLENLIENQRI